MLPQVLWLRGVSVFWEFKKPISPCFFIHLPIPGNHFVIPGRKLVCQRADLSWIQTIIQRSSYLDVFFQQAFFLADCNQHWNLTTQNSEHCCISYNIEAIWRLSMLYLRPTARTLISPSRASFTATSIISERVPPLYVVRYRDLTIVTSYQKMRTH